MLNIKSAIITFDYFSFYRSVSVACISIKSIQNKNPLVCFCLCANSLYFEQKVWLFHSFMLFLYRLFKSTTAQRRSRRSTDPMLRGNFTPKRHRQLRVKDLPMVPTWRLEQDSNPRSFGRKASMLPMSRHVPGPMYS